MEVCLLYCMKIIFCVVFHFPDLECEGSLCLLDPVYYEKPFFEWRSPLDDIPGVCIIDVCAGSGYPFENSECPMECSVTQVMGVGVCQNINHNCTRQHKEVVLVYLL
jgi:hypothetical protein